LIDVRTSSCVDILKCIMESPRILKVMWGADGDCQSLMYQTAPVPLQVQPASVLDVQLAFSTPVRRLGMKHMLEAVPKELLLNMPEKEQIDWDTPHSLNARALPFPLSSRDAAYAMDDVLRIEAILRSQAAPGGSYVCARASTDAILEEIRGDPCGLKALQTKFQWFQRYIGLKKTVAAVGLKRHILALRARGAELGDQEALVSNIEDIVAVQLLASKVVVPADLSFAGDCKGSNCTAAPADGPPDFNAIQAGIEQATLCESADASKSTEAATSEDAASTHVA